MLPLAATFLLIQGLSDGSLTLQIDSGLDSFRARDRPVASQYDAAYAAKQLCNGGNARQTTPPYASNVNNSEIPKSRHQYVFVEEQQTRTEFYLDLIYEVGQRSYV